VSAGKGKNNEIIIFIYYKIKIRSRKCGLKGAEAREPEALDALEIVAEDLTRGHP
jgi:hypothetical protein